MKTLFSERFKSARLMKGYSLQDLETVLEKKVSRQALHKYEKGEVIPDSEMLGHLCNALEVSPDYFFRDKVISLGEIEYRKLKDFPAKEVNRIVEQTKDYLARYLELEEILELSSEFINPVGDLKKVETFQQVEEAAAIVRERWKIGNGPIAGVYELLEDNHIKIIEIEAGEDYDGMQTFVNENIPVIVINKRKINKADRQRFTALHELAHLLLPIRHLSEKQRETLCHQFAGALLIHPDVLKKEMGGEKRLRISVQELGAIKQEYGISMQAIVMRAKDLNIISQNYCRQFFSMLKMMNWRVEEPVDYHGCEVSNRFDQLLYRALAQEFISVSKAASLKNQKLAEFKSKSLLAG
ncbi:MAG: XRE family transcriptional regulator [Chitinophagaceae bacterium]